MYYFARSSTQKIPHENQVKTFLSKPIYHQRKHGRVCIVVKKEYIYILLCCGIKIARDNMEDGSAKREAALCISY